ncbi:hypothetical protein ACFW04_009193 [Cataglyphis niger]
MANEPEKMSEPEGKNDEKDEKDEKEEKEEKDEEDKKEEKDETVTVEKQNLDEEKKKENLEIEMTSREPKSKQPKACEEDPYIVKLFKNLMKAENEKIPVDTKKK